MGGFYGLDGEYVSRSAVVESDGGADGTGGFESAMDIISKTAAEVEFVKFPATYITRTTGEDVLQAHNDDWPAESFRHRIYDVAEKIHHRRVIGNSV
jgi:hypothetical protein